MKTIEERLKGDLEPILQLRDPRPVISAYHDMPFAIFVYPSRQEFALRDQVRQLRSRLDLRSKHVITISLADCLDQALKAEGLGGGGLAEAERTSDLPAAIDTAFNILSDYQPLDQLVAARVPADANPLIDLVFLVRAGALFPLYRTSALLEQLKGKIAVPMVLFYPGQLVPPAGLRFMEELDAEHNYRPRIF